jgi:Amino acid permease
MTVLDLLLGRPLASDEARGEQIGSLVGVPVFGLDALSSAAYGPEAALTLLIPLSLAGIAYIVPISVSIIVLLTIVYFSYRQTIQAYPGGGGSYTVARQNLGASAGLLAAAALMIDYVLVVAVGISAGVGALVSAVPRLQPWTLLLCLVILALITLVNLRGAIKHWSHIVKKALRFALKISPHVRAVHVDCGEGALIFREEWCRFVDEPTREAGGSYTAARCPALALSLHSFSDCRLRPRRRANVSEPTGRRFDSRTGPTKVVSPSLAQQTSRRSERSAAAKRQPANCCDQRAVVPRIVRPSFRKVDRHFTVSRADGVQLGLLGTANGSVSESGIE